MQKFTLRIDGRMPLVTHNVRLANPLDTYARALKDLTKKTKKTEDDHLAIQRTEWEGGLYIDEARGPYMPVANVRRSLAEAAGLMRLKAALMRGMFISATDGSERAALEYEGPRDIDGLWKANATYLDYRAVALSASSRMMRARPRFPTWGCELEVLLDVNEVDAHSFTAIVERAGRSIGLGEKAEGGQRARYNAVLTEVPFEEELAA